MGQFIIRLDDACEKRNIQKWNAMEELLDRYAIKPLVGVIPYCEDPAMADYPVDEAFWERVKIWQKKGWAIALHGYNHVYGTKEGGINPVHKRSEFAGESLETQREKIRKGVAIMRAHGIDPEIFFAPSHTFDKNTLEALKLESNIRIISDTIAIKSYQENGFTFVPQQCGRVRNLPFAVTTFCYHPNTLSDGGLCELEKFLSKHQKFFVSFPVERAEKPKGLLDEILSKIYFLRR